MSLHFVLDGYNIIKQTLELADETLENGRTKLIRFIETGRPQGSSKNKVTIIFDGQADVFGSEQRYGNVKIFFTSNETADDKIKRLVDQQDNKKNIVVVTNDREIQYYVRALGARVLGVNEFLSKAAPQAEKAARRKSGGSVPGEKKYISKSFEHKVNKELEGIWLDKETDI